MKNIKIIVSLFLFYFGNSAITNAQKIAAGGWHSVVVCNDKTAKAFGENATGQLGNGSNTDSNVPVLTGLTNVVAVSAGGDQLEAHSMALKNDGTVWAWGSNLYGGLGNASTTNTSTPVQSLLLSNIIAISAGGWHSLALKDDGTVWAWGWNLDGQLGDGSTTDKIIAGQVPSLSNITHIAAGTYHNIALKNDGTVWCWGDNLYGQIGNGSIGTDVKSPTQVLTLTNVVAIAAGRFFSLAVKDDGSVWTWGQNLYGQLGDGTTTDRNTPVQVSGLIVALPAIVAAGAFHCTAVKTDGTAWAWGRNTYGNLGDNTVTDRSLPVQMNGVADVAGMANGTNFSLLYKTNGTFWGCGRNTSGQLGDATFTQRNELSPANDVCPILLSIHSQTSANNFQWNLFPNPSENGIFNLEGNEEFTKISVYNLLGEKVFEDELINTTSKQVDLSNQPNGVYIIRLTVNNSTYSVKLIKQ